MHSWANWNSPFQTQCAKATRLPADGPGKGTCDLFNDTWFGAWRHKGHSVASRAHVLRAEARRLVDAEWEAINPNRSHPVLTVHMRGTDKASNRHAVPPSAFEPYVASFLGAFPGGCVFAATESGEEAQRYYWTHIAS